MEREEIFTKQQLQRAEALAVAQEVTHRTEQKAKPPLSTMGGYTSERGASIKSLIKLAQFIVGDGWELMGYTDDRGLTPAETEVPIVPEGVAYDDVTYHPGWTIEDYERELREKREVFVPDEFLHTQDDLTNVTFFNSARWPSLHFKRDDKRAGVMVTNRDSETEVEPGDVKFEPSMPVVPEGVAYTLADGTSHYEEFGTPPWTKTANDLNPEPGDVDYHHEKL